MSTIIAPNYPSNGLFLGKGISGKNSLGNTINFNVFGRVLPNSLGSEFNSLGMQSPFSAMEPTTYFDVGTLTENHEVVVVGYNTGVINGPITFTYTWYRRRDNALIFQFSVNANATGTTYSAAAWIGWLAENVAVGTYPAWREIQENGDYYVVVNTSGAENGSRTANFVVVGIPAQTVLRYPTSSGFEWTVRTTNYFDSSNYIRVGIATQPVSDGSSSPPSNILSNIYAPSSNVGCAAVGSVSGLNSSQTYTLYGFAQAANGLYYRAGSFTNTTLEGVPGAPSAPVDFTTRIEGGFNLFWGPSPSNSSTTYYELNYKPSYISTWSIQNVIFGASTTLGGLQYGVTYDFRVRAWNSYGYSEFTNESSWTTAPKTPTISQGNVTNNSITINAGSMSGNYDEIQIQRYSASSVYIDEKYCQANGSVTFDNLPAGTTYIFKARSKFFINNINLYSVNFSNNLTIQTSTRPTNWVWPTPKVSGQNFNMPSSEWNSFTDRINAFRVYKGLYTYGFTTAPYGSGDFYAFMYNQAVNAIKEMSPATPPPSTKNTGDDVYASLVNDLRDSLNSVA